VISTDVSARLSPAYWRLWTASTISNLGDGVFLVALPLLASRLTRSELSISFIGVAAALPWLLLSLPIGAIVDRIDHRLLMVRSDFFRTAVVGALAIAAASHNVHIWMLWVTAGCLGVAEVFFDNASQGAMATAAMAFGTTVWNTITVSLRQRIVPASLFGRVNSVYRWVVWGSISIGAALGGIVAREFGLRAPFFVGTGFGAIALITLFFSITPRALALVRT
jgi:hypothetical protein